MFPRPCQVGQRVVRPAIQKEEGKSHHKSTVRKANVSSPFHTSKGCTEHGEEGATRTQEERCCPAAQWL